MTIKQTDFTTDQLQVAKTCLASQTLQQWHKSSTYKIVASAGI